MKSDQDKFDDDVEIGEEHSAIRAVVQWIEKMTRQRVTDSGEVAGGKGVLDALQSFRDELARHFRFEEESGVLEAAMMLDGNGSHILAGWKREHRDLLAHLDRLLAVRGEGDALPPTFVRDLQQFFARLRCHDAFETELLGEERAAHFRAGDA